MWPFLFWPFWYVAALDFHCGRFGLICNRFGRDRFGCSSSIAMFDGVCVWHQLVYHDLSGRWSFGVYVRDAERVKCMNTEQIDAGRHQPTSPSHGVYQHCYTSAVLQLSRFDNVSIRCLYGSRSVVMQPEFTFWGLIQLRSTAGPR